MGRVHDLGLKYKISTLRMNNKKEWGFMYQTPMKVEGRRTGNAIQYTVKSFSTAQETILAITE